MTKGKVIPSGWWVNQTSSSKRGHVSVKPQNSNCDHYCNNTNTGYPYAGQCNGGFQFVANHCVIPANIPGCTAGQVLRCSDAD